MFTSSKYLHKSHVFSPGFKTVLIFLVALIGLASHDNLRIIQAQEAVVDAKADSLRQTRFIAAAGKPYGVGQVEFPLSLALEKGWHSDQGVKVVCSNCKIWLTACSRVTNPVAAAADDPSEARPSTESLHIYFLYSGENPGAAEVQISGKPCVKVQSDVSDVPHAQLMQRWWKALRDQQSGIPPAIQDLTSDFLSAIGKHLRVSSRPQPFSKKEGVSTLEKHFERTLGMLLGFESVRLAMMIDDKAETAGPGPAIHPLPNPVNVIGQRLPASAPLSNDIEPIASLVPNDCFYLRCGSINNYMWLRRFLIGWGGSLDEIVTNTILDTDVRSRIEDQLGINSKALLDADSSVNDLAIIGSDVFFDEGAGLGVLIEAKQGEEAKLEAIIYQQRAEKGKLLGAMQHADTIENHRASLFRTPDNRMRSFYARRGRYLLVTNSQAILTSVLRPQAAARSLSNLQEYRYAVATKRPANSGITLYLSDPFIRRIASPAFRIELGRRRASAEDCRQLEVAALVAKALGKRWDSKHSLVEENFLPENFGIRPDGSQVDLRSGGALDSMRGKAGTFIPVADVAVTRANQDEVSAYTKFSQRYRAEWPSMDPVLVSIASANIGENMDRVELKIHITPYARNEYSFLTQYLSQASPQHATLSHNELMGVSARLRTQAGNVLAYIGIRDTNIPGRIVQGELQRTDGRSMSFATQQSFAAVSPSGIDGLQAISGLMRNLQNRKAETSPGNPLPTPLSIFNFNPYSMGRIPTSAELMILTGEHLVKGLLGITQLNSIYEDGQWSIYGGSAELRQEVRNSLVLQELDQPSQLLLQVRDVSRSEIAPYLNAFSFCQSRKQSAAIASWLNAWSSGLQTDPGTFRKDVEHALHGELHCPLGGEFTLDEPPTHWTSTKWEQAPLATVDHVPAEYQFPFLQWLKGVELKFNLASASLNSDVVLDVSRANNSGSPSFELRNFHTPIEASAAATTLAP